MNEELLKQFIKDHLGIKISRFDSAYIIVDLTWDGVEFAEDMCDVPSYAIRENIQY